MSFLRTNGRAISPSDTVLMLGGQRNGEHFNFSKTFEVTVQSGFMDKMGETELGKMAMSGRTLMAAL